MILSIPASGIRKKRKLDQLRSNEQIAMGDLILAEVLQGLTHERDFNEAIQAAQNFRTLRKQGVTVRKTIDTVPFVSHLGLRVVA